ncbi:MAG: NADH-quinone oxidoreductase subunit M [Pseudanabaenaceae cyanobacterium]
MPTLSLLVWLPIGSALLVFLLPKSVTSNYCQKLAFISAIISLLPSLALGQGWDLQRSGWQLQEQTSWLEVFGLHYSLGLDTISLPLVWLHNLLVGVAIWASDRVERPRLYFGLLLLLSGGVTGAFLATNLLLFFLFYELELIPLYLLIAIWGGEGRAYASTKFLIYTAVSGILMLVAFFGVSAFASAPDTISFDWQYLHTHPIAPGLQAVFLGVLLVSFGIKIPLVPLHTWLPDAHVEASTPISVLLAGVLLKLGTYGLLRFGLGLFPEAWQNFAPYLAAWAVVSVLYGCFTAITQTDMKKMVAYSSIGHMGYVLLALASATPLSLVGAMWQMLSHGLISALLFLLVGIVYAKAGTRDLHKVQGLFNPECGLPFVGTMLVLSVMASAGIPGLMGFVAEFLVFRGSFTVFPMATLFCILGTALTAVYFLILVDRTFFGRLERVLLPVQWQERAPVVVLVTIVVGLGLQPSWLTALWQGTFIDLSSG